MPASKMKDRYGNELATRSIAARDAYVAGVDSLMAASAGTDKEFAAAVAADEGFALGHISLARAKQLIHELDKKIGTLSPGKKADIVMLRANDVNMVPVWDPVYSIVEIAGAGNVDTVIIDGVVAKKDGKLTIDEATLRRRTDELTESGARIMRDGNYRVASAPH